MQLTDLKTRCLRPFTATPGRRRVPLGLAAQSSQTVTEKLKPDWAGDDLLSRAVNAAIGFKPLYALMKVGAKHVLQSTAERNGVPWRATACQLENTPEIREIRAELEDPAVEYPDYYVQPFHAYEEGNLNWLAAFEVESATYSMALRTFPEAGLSPAQAQQRLRDGIHGALRSFQQRQAARAVADALDIGCSAGVSSRFLAAEFPDAQVTGVDLSPHFLAVAEWRERTEPRPGRRRVRYRHAPMEATGLPGGSADLVAASFVIHECRPHAIRALIAEARRLLRPRGVLLLADNNPRSKTIQNLPPALFTLMKSTEPWSDEYYQMDIEAAMREAGFLGVETAEADHRHRAVLGLAPPDSADMG